MSHELLTDLVAVVTGASRKGGIGRAICARLAELGARVVVSDIGHPLPTNPEYPIPSTEALEETVNELESLGAEALGVMCDVTRPDEVQMLVEATVSRFGRLDIWVNNAGIAVGSVEIVDVDIADAALMFDVNLKGTYIGVQAAARQLIKQGHGGRIINIASQAGKTGWPLLSGYSASKFGVIGITQSVAQEVGKHGITVNAVCPGTVDTELTSGKNGTWQMNARQQGITVEEAREQEIRKIPLGRLQQPRDVADLVAFLASTSGGYITGAAINTTGGQEMH